MFFKFIILPDIILPEIGKVNGRIGKTQVLPQVLRQCGDNFFPLTALQNFFPRATRFLLTKPARKNIILL